MLKLKAIIVDDELHGRENLKSLLTEYCPEIKIAGVAESAQTARKLVYEKNPDIVFLDINMPIMDGFDFLESLPERNFSVVFVSAHIEYGARAVRANAVDFLLKPVSTKELQQCVKNLISIHKQFTDKTKTLKSNHKIVLSQFNGFSVFETDEIIRLEADDNYTTVYINGKKPVTISKTLKHFEDYCEDSFFRIHKSHIINLKHIKSFSNLDGGYVVMSDGSKIAISRRRLNEFMDKVKTIIN